jgi:hypothetical protein
MAKAFDKDGNEIDVFSQEEIDAKIKEALEKAEAESKSQKEAADAKAAAEKATAEAAAGQKNDEVPEWAKPIIAAVDSLKSNHTQTYVERVAAGLDADKRKLVESKFSSLSGYEDTADGLARKAEDAFLLATGEKFNAGTVNMQNLMAAGGGQTQTKDKVVTEADKEIQSALGITSADVEKFGKKS